ncbi:hypothetical protein M2390_000824 [Mycetocola sp. BIGb0189]|uniref:Ig-like domain-containing protein n=1 Tax=Mycetocola sp. BIGb0189 TaxID=2940604 RepID=UPI002167D91E|nr:Ig-like domain-containing protein [Mycetocola sp. BIGb0189]MCS4275663.1 hypothetical protein [Mycetocola sp. BIGb0189]
MSMRKTMTAAALCTVALGSLIAQPAFATTLIDPSPKASTTASNQVNADLAMSAITGVRGASVTGTLSFPGGTAYGQIKVTAPAGTKITATDWTEYIAPDGSYALMGKNSDYWNAKRTVTFAVLNTNVAGTALTGGKVEVIKDGVTNKTLDFGATVKSALKSVSTPSFSQAYNGTSTVKFDVQANGQLKFIAPSGTRIKAIDNSLCTISADKKSAICGANTDYWIGDRAVTLESDGAYLPGTYSDGLVQVIYDGVVVDSHAFAATTTATIRATDQVVDAGAVARIPMVFSPQIWGTMTLTAPAGTTFATTGQPSGSVVSADGKTLTRQPTGSWSGTVNFLINTPNNAVPGTVFGGGVGTMSAGDVATARVEYKVTVSNKVAKPTVTVNHNTLSGTGIPGATINVRNSANDIVGTKVVGTDGTWSIDVPFQGNGHQAMNISQVFGTGTSDTVLATIDFGQGVQVTTPANNGTVTTEKTTFTGTGTVGATIEVKGTSKSICTTTVKADGTWTCDSTIALANGKYAFQVVQTSGTIPSTTSVNFTRAYNTTATPVKFTSPANNSTVYNARPLFKGTGQPGAAIRVHGTTRTVATTTVKADGTWEAPAEFDLAGDLILNVTQTPTNAATSTDTVKFGIRTGASSDVVVTTPANNSTVDTHKVTYTGKGEPGSKITINGTTRPVASTTVKADGTWSVDGDFDLPNSTYKFRVSQEDVNTGDLKHTDLTFTVEVK